MHVKSILIAIEQKKCGEMRNYVAKWICEFLHEYFENKTVAEPIARTAWIDFIYDLMTWVELHISPSISPIRPNKSCIYWKKSDLITGLS